MENLVAALKLLGPIMLTPLINRVISSFRFRQLYLSFEDVLPYTLPENNGYIANIRLYNKGKNKETKIEIIFPRTSTCQILSSNYPTVSNEGARIIDRPHPAETNHHTDGISQNRIQNHQNQQTFSQIGGYKRQGLR